MHHLLHDGSFAEVIAADHEGMAGSTIPGRKRCWNSPLRTASARQPARSLVWVRGRLQQVPPEAVTQMLDEIAAENPDPALLQVETPISVPSGGGEPRYTLLRLEIASVVVTDATGAEPVSVADLLAARPDPFCEIESSLLWHLDTVHNDVVARLVLKTPGAIATGASSPARARPIRRAVPGRRPRGRP